MSIKTLIVEQDNAVLRKLATVLGLEDDFEVVGAHSNIRSAVTALAKLTPDVLFLDCGLPLAECCEVLSWSNLDHATVCVLLGGASSVSLPQFSVPTLGYLQRPLKLSQLASSLERIRDWAHLPSRVATRIEAAQLLDPERLMLRRGKSLVFIPLADIEFIKASGNYLRVQVADQSYRFRETIGEMQARVPPHFVRTHRSYIVNSRAIAEFYADGDGGYLLALRGGRSLPVGPTYVASMRDWLVHRPKFASVEN